MGVDRILSLKLVADVADINSKMASTEASVGKVGKAFGGLTSFMGPVVIDAAITGIGMLADGLAGGVEDAKKFNDALTGLTATLAPLGVGATDARALADAAAAAGSALGFADDDQVVRGLQAFAEQTGSVADAQKLLAAAFDLSRLKGIDLEAATAKVQAIYKGSSRTLAEFGVTGKKGMDAVTAALGDNSTAAETWATTSQGQYAVVAAGIDDAFQGAGSAINDVVNNTVLPAIAQLLPIIGNLWATWQPILANLGTQFGAIIGKVLEVWNKLQPAFQAFLDFVNPVLLNLELALQTLGTVVGGVLDTIIALLNGDFTGAFKAIQATVDAVIAAIQTAFGNMLAFMSGIVGTVLQAAQNIGGAIFDGVTGALAGIADAIATPIRNGLNTIIDIWNGLGIHIPEVVLFEGFGRRDTFGPIDFELPDIPHLAKGGLIRRPTLVLAGESGPEVISPLGHGMGGGNHYTVNVNVAPGADLAEAGRQMTVAIRAFERRGGKNWRAA